jgi:hypothetical protein
MRRPSIIRLETSHSTVMALHPSLPSAGAAADPEQAPVNERITLTAVEDAFLNSEPAYEGDVDTVPAPPPTAAPAPVAPLATRRLGSLLVFSLVVGSASLVLGLAVLRGIGQALLP